MTDIAVVLNNAPIATYMFPIVTAETALRIEVTDVIGMGLPIGVHLREEVGLEDSLGLSNGSLYRGALVVVNRWVVLPIESINP